jgi:hypothetical protein
VEMEEWSGKEKVMKLKGKLRGKKKTEKIFIDNDITKPEREIQKKLGTIAEEKKKRRERSKSGIYENNNRGSTVKME